MILNFARSVSSIVFRFFKLKSLHLDDLFAYLCFVWLWFLNIKNLNGFSGICFGIYSSSPWQLITLGVFPPLFLKFRWNLPLVLVYFVFSHLIEKTLSVFQVKCSIFFIGMMLWLHCLNWGLKFCKEIVNYSSSTGRRMVFQLHIWGYSWETMGNIWGIKN